MPLGSGMGSIPEEELVRVAADGDEYSGVGRKRGVSDHAVVGHVQAVD